MKYRQNVCLMFALAFCLTSQAVAEDCEKDQGAINECAAARFEAKDKELNVVYQELVKLAAGSGTPELKSTIVKAQRAWVAFRDAECSVIGLRGGSIRPYAVAECFSGLTDQRIKRLKELATCDDETDVSCIVMN
jgi:uncharacterized protein YecT (DUF1311 family)